jgi:RNA polymerase sigma-70 factor (ECF subfamily)
MTAVAKKNQRSLFSSGREDESAQTCWVSGELLPDDIVESNEFATIVHEEVDKLPAVYGSTFTLFVLQAMSYEEITQVTGLPLGTVNARIFRARILLREAIVKRMNAVLG